MTEENKAAWSKIVSEMMAGKDLSEQLKITAKIWAYGAARVSRMLEKA